MSESAVRLVLAAFMALTIVGNAIIDVRGKRPYEAAGWLVSGLMLGALFLLPDTMPRTWIQIALVFSTLALTSTLLWRSAVRKWRAG